MNSFTLEASFHGYLTKERITVEFLTTHFMKMGNIVGESLYEYVLILEQDEKNKKQKAL